MWLKKWFQPPRHLLGLFLGITLVLAVALAWLGYRLYQQDRQLERQQIQQQLTHAADLVVAGLLRELSSQQERLAGLLALSDAELAAQAPDQAEALGSDAAIVILSHRRLQWFPAARLPYDPSPISLEAPSPGVFTTGEALEFRQKDYARAGATFRRLGTSENPSIRAGALLRLGRTLRKSGQPAAALAVYGELLELGAIPAGGLPADLLARHSRCVLLEELGRHRELLAEASTLHAALHDGRWRLPRGGYLYYVGESRRWYTPGPDVQAQEAHGVALAAGTELLWETWQRVIEGGTPSAGHSGAWLHGRPVLLMWQSTRSRMVGLVAGSAHVEEKWLSAVQPVLDRQAVRVGLSDSEGHPVVGGLSGPASPQAVLTPADTQLPWTVHAVLADPGAATAALAGRRRLMLLGLALAGLLVVVGSYFVSRAVTRELEVARLQSNFVSAVSHEFRSPLASMRQLSELLWEGRVSSEERRRQYYLALRRESERLHRLVEGLLDFGRMEAGAREYRFETLDPAGLVQDVAREFTQEVEERGYTLELDLNGSLAPVRADPEALSRALWNLLDNAVKYSPVCRTIWVEATRLDTRLAVRVRDQGLGIPPAEQPRIFKKFVRAANAGDGGVKGTGLGLAMVHHIVAAHGGEIQVESRPGVGSTFTILLPAAKERR
jgi:signal transduction histidine kinase